MENLYEKVENGKSTKKRKLGLKLALAGGVGIGALVGLGAYVKYSDAPFGYEKPADIDLNFEATFGSLGKNFVKAFEENGKEDKKNYSDKTVEKISDKLVRDNFDLILDVHINAVKKTADHYKNVARDNYKYKTTTPEKKVVTETDHSKPFDGVVEEIKRETEEIKPAVGTDVLFEINGALKH